MRDESHEHESLARNLRGKVVFSSEGEEVGVVEDLLYSRISEVPEWFIVRAKHGKSTLVVPVAGFDLQDGGLKVPYSVSLIENQPQFAIKHGLEEDAETAFDDYFRLGAL